MRLQQLQSRAIQIQQLSARLNEREHDRHWTNEELMLGFAGDVGDLTRQVMAAEGARSMTGGRAALSHELSECL